MTSDHLDKSSVWKPLVASCVCVAGVRLDVCSWSSTYVFNELASSPKRARLQRQMCFVSGPIQNAFVASDERVCLHCDDVFGGCLVASDQHVRLQCDIEFGCETSCILKGGLETPQKEQKS